MALENKITVKFNASGDKALERAISELHLAQTRLQKGTRAYDKAVKRLRLDKEKLNREFGLAVKNNRLLSNSFATLRSKMLLVSFAASIVAATIGKVFKAASEQQQAEIKLSSALGRTSKELLNHASAMQKVTRFGDEVTISAMSNIAAFIQDEDTIKSLTTATMDLAAAKGMDLASAADLVAKSVGSTTNALARYGIAANGAAKSTERADSVVRSISVLYGGQAKAQAESYAGTIDGMMNAVGDAAEAIGELLAPAVIAFAKIIKDTSNAIEAITDKLGGLAQATFNYFFGLKNLKDATVDYSDSLKDFQSKLKGLTFAELSSEIETLQTMLPKQKESLEANATAFGGYSDTIDLANINVSTISESTGQLIEKDGQLIATTVAIANANVVMADTLDRLNLALKDNETRQAFAQELYAKTSQSQGEAVQGMIDWVKANEGAFESTDQYRAVLEMLNGQLNKTGEGFKAMADQAVNTAGAITSAYSNMTSAQSENLNARMKNDMDRLKKSEMYENASAKRKKKLEEGVQKKFSAERKKIWKQQQQAKLSQALIDGYGAVTTTFDQFGWPWGLFLQVL